MTPRKHAELIKAWADGAEIQVLECGYWHDCPAPVWNEKIVYRLKPVPKADYIRRGFMDFRSPDYGHSGIPVNVTFSGETGEPKKVEIVK
jgi:hypothetical protein